MSVQSTKMTDIDKLKERGENCNIVSKCEDVILEAKKILLNEELEKIANFTLSTIQNKCTTNAETFSRSCKNMLDWKNDLFWNDLPNPKGKVGIMNTTDWGDINNENLNEVISEILQVGTAVISKNCALNSINDERSLLKRYFEIWRDKVKAKKEKFELKNCTIMNQQDKLDSFITTLEKHKNRKIKGSERIKREAVESINNEKSMRKYFSSYPKQYNKYKNRFNAQKIIIDMQKAKLEEQNKIIQQLKVGIIQDDLLKSIENTKTNIREIFSTCSEKVKCKIPLVLLEEPKFTINTQKAPKTIQQMEQRALERAQKREIILQRKRFIEEKRQKMLEESVEKKRVLEEEEKKRNLEIMRERRKKELEQEKIKQANRQRYFENLNKAVEFHNKILIEQCLKKLYNNLLRSREKCLFACQYYDKKILKKTFTVWTCFIESLYTVKYETADAHFEYTILKRTLNIWREDYLENIRNMQVAEDLYDFRLTSNTFINWHRHVCTEILLQDKKMKIAENHFKRRILFYYFYQWRSLKAVNQLEKAKELQKRKWREKVWEILPDYKPPIDLYD